MRPSRITPTRSAMASASSWSWVTNRVVMPTSSWIRADLVPQLRADLGVERGQRLVQQQHLGLDGQGPGQRDPLLLPAGDLVRVAVRLLGQPDQLQHLQRPPVPLAPGRSGAAAARRPTFCRTVMCGNSE